MRHEGGGWSRSRGKAGPEVLVPKGWTVRFQLLEPPHANRPGQFGEESCRRFACNLESFRPESPTTRKVDPSLQIRNPAAFRTAFLEDGGSRVADWIRVEAPNWPRMILESR